MIFTVPLQSGTTLSNVRYRWIAAGIEGSEQSSGITQPDVTWPLFVIHATPPANAQEIRVYDSTDSDNWNVGDYTLAELASRLGVIPSHSVTASVSLSQNNTDDIEAADIRYRWLVNDVFQSEQSSGVTQPNAAEPFFVIGATAPAGAQELIAYDTNDNANWNVANYLVTALSLATTTPETLPPAVIRTLNFRDDVLWALAELVGLDPTNDMNDEQATAFVSYINTWVRRLYELLDWPEWTFIEQRTVSGHYVDLNEAGKTPIGRPLKVYLRDPNSVNGLFHSYFKWNASGIHVGFSHGLTVWVKFVGRAPEFGWSVRDDTVTYSAGQVVYDPTSGDCYKSLVNNNQGHALTENDYWTVVEFPYALVGPVVRGAYSMFLREDGQASKADKEEEAALNEVMQRAQSYIAQRQDTVTDQKKPLMRYHDKIPAAA